MKISRFLGFTRFIEKKKIVLFGLSNYDNLGDPLLSECCEYVLKKHFTGFDIYKAEILPNLKRRSIVIIIVRKLLQILYAKIPKFSDYLIYLLYRLSGYSYYKNNIKNADAIVFVGGAYLKWKGEYFQYGIRNILSYADRYNIPVMFNGIGVEGYDEKDIRCKRLAESINKDCVKVITTRDDIDTLNKFFVRRKNIKTALVGDVALFLDELYNVQQEGNRKCVGINVAYPNLFSVYGVDSNYTLFELLESIIKKFQIHGIEFKLYCNGKIDDYNGGLLLVKKLGLKEDLLLPRPTNSLELINQINSFKCIIPLRLHSCIIAYSLGVDFASFVWNPKMMLFARVIQRTDDFQLIKDFNVDWLIDRIESSSLIRDERRKEELKIQTEKFLIEFVKENIL